MKPIRVLVAIGVVGGIAFGFAGGEYSTGDWWTLRKALAAETEASQRLRIEIDSLSHEAQALETDPVAQEREARERFGMLRPGEIMYRVGPRRRPEP